MVMYSKEPGGPPNLKLTHGNEDTSKPLEIDQDRMNDRTIYLLYPIQNSK